MKNFAIFGPDAKKSDFQGVDIQRLEIDGRPVNCGIVDTTDPIFKRDDPANLHKVLIRVKAFSLNFRDKALIFKMSKHGPANGIYVIGSEFAAEVVEVGQGVNELIPGDVVIGNNSYPSSGWEGVPPGVPTNHSSKEMQVLHQAKLAKIPKRMPMDVAAAFSIGGQTTYSMLRRLELYPGANVLVTSAKSNTSLFCINALKRHNVNVYATTTSNAFESDLKALGVKEMSVVPFGVSFLEDPAIAKVVQLGGFQFVADPYWDLHLSRSIEILATGGKYITCGLYDQYLSLIGKPALNLPRRGDELTSVMVKNLSIMGNCIGTTEDLTKALDDYSAGALKVVVDSVFSDGNAAAFMERSYCAKDRFGKVIYRYS